ncbi:hypothetical protein J1605_017119 [Eschrichtius robustus]|uniref:Uncharacterized protein n=1 Tax=Eschrichtius robustus TaxID=9764 RepID=A0AB34HZ90_ESCRO|nr:hypothetical protein J1605_017119 [Eschrichtius robustus]
MECKVTPRIQRSRPDQRGGLGAARRRPPGGSGPARACVRARGRVRSSGPGAWSARARPRVRLREGCVCARGGSFGHPPTSEHGTRRAGGECGQGWVLGRRGALGGPRPGWRAWHWDLLLSRRALLRDTEARAAGPGGGQGGAAHSSGPLPGAAGVEPRAAAPRVLGLRNYPLPHRVSAGGGAAGDTEERRGAW